MGIKTQRWQKQTKYTPTVQHANCNLTRSGEGKIIMTVKTELKLGRPT